MRKINDYHKWVLYKKYVFNRAMKIVLEDLQIVLGKLKGQNSILGAAALLFNRDK